MCNYKYINVGINLKDKLCIYPEFCIRNTFKNFENLPIDNSGFCLFHSEDEEWKEKNNFKLAILELLDLIEKENIEKKSWEYNLIGFIFCKDFIFENIEFKNGMNLSNSIFKNKIQFKNITISSIDFQHSRFLNKLYIQNSTVKSNIYAGNSEFQNGMFISNSKLNDYSFFDDCIFLKPEGRAECEISFEKCDSISSISFDNSNIQPRISFSKSTINRIVSFDNSKIYDEFFFKENILNGTLSFIETDFLLDKSKNDRTYPVEFGNNIHNKFSKVEFKGKTQQSDMVKGELAIYFKKLPEGLISFDNFNLNKIFPEDKKTLLELEKTNPEIISISPSCQKYYCKTDLFIVLTSESNQNLIVDIINVFTNFFKLNESFNLGVEIVGRTKTEITYYYFTDEKIELIEFLSKISKTEQNLWDTLSNITNYAVQAVKDDNSELADCLFNLESWWKKIGFRIARNQLNPTELTIVVNSIALEKKSEDFIVLEFQKIYEQFNLSLERKSITLNIEGMVNMNNTNAKIGKIIVNDYSQQITQVANDNKFTEEQLVKFKEILEIVKKEPEEKKENKLVELAQKFLPTIAEVAITVAKPFIFPA